MERGLISNQHIADESIKGSLCAKSIAVKRCDECTNEWAAVSTVVDDRYVDGCAHLAISIK